MRWSHTKRSLRSREQRSISRGGGRGSRLRRVAPPARGLSGPVASLRALRGPPRLGPAAGWPGLRGALCVRARWCSLRPRRGSADSILRPSGAEDQSRRSPKRDTFARLTSLLCLPESRQGRYAAAMAVGQHGLRAAVVFDGQRVGSDAGDEVFEPLAATLDGGDWLGTFRAAANPATTGTAAAAGPLRLRLRDPAAVPSGPL